MCGPLLDQTFDATRSVIKQMLKTGTKDHPVNAVVPPANRLPDSLSVELIAVTSAADEEDFTAKLADGVAVGEPDSDDKFPRVEDG